MHTVNWLPFFSGLHRARAARPAGARRLVRAKHEVDRRYVEPLRLDEIAAAARLSKFHLIRAFADTFRRTPHHDLVERRLREARRLLEQTDRSVTDICFDVGFESLGSFVTLFKREDAALRTRRRSARRRSFLRHEILVVSVEIRRTGSRTSCSTWLHRVRIESV